MLTGATTHTNFGISSDMLRIPGIPGSIDDLYQVPMQISYENKTIVKSVSKVGRNIFGESSGIVRQRDLICGYQGGRLNWLAFDGMLIS